jgi:hypothetical protein
MTLAGLEVHTLTIDRVEKWHDAIGNLTAWWFCPVAPDIEGRWEICATHPHGATTWRRIRLVRA